MFMLTPLTQAAIMILGNVYMGTKRDSSKSLILSPEDMDLLLGKLTTAGLIRLIEETPKKHDSLQIPDTGHISEKISDLSSYCLARNPSEVSLLDILEAVDEPLDCSKAFPEDFYSLCGPTIHKLGIISQIARKYLKEIKLYNL